MVSFGGAAYQYLGGSWGLEHDHRDFAGCGAAVVLPPPWICFETSGDMKLPLFARQLAGLHLD